VSLFIVDARFADAYPNGLAEFTLALTPPLLRHLEQHGALDRVVLLRTLPNACGHPRVRSFWSEMTAMGVRIVDAPAPLTIRSTLWESWFCFLRDIGTWVTYHYNVPFVFRGDSAAVVHDMMPLALPGYLKGRSAPLKAIVFSFLVRRLLGADRNITFTPSRFTLQEMPRRLGRGPRRWALLNPGISQEFSVPPQPGWRSPSKLILFFIGERRPHKNVLRLIRIGRLLAERVPCEVVIAGKDHDYYFALREELGGPIRYVGEVNDSTKRDLMLNASYVVLLSDYEGYGMPVSEANALGVPVLTSLGTVMAEMCSDSDCIVDISWPDEKIAANVFEHWRAGPHLKQPQARLWPDVAAEFINRLSDDHYFDHYSLQKQ